jgi:phosphoribosyl 1,2-cyclic phosphodiesterase
VAVRYRIPVWMSQGTYAALGAPDFDGMLRIAHDMQTVDLGTFSALPFTVPHDAREPLQLRCSDGASHLGVLTDLGHASDHVLQQLQGCHALMIEANHDPAMLEASRYPTFVRHPGLQRVVAAHLSAQNNAPGLAQQALGLALEWPAEEITVASPTEGTPWLAVAG